MAFSYTVKEERQIFSNSPERMINTTLEILSKVNAPKDKAYIAELIDINYQDWCELKNLVCKVWHDKQNEMRKLKV